MIYFSRASPPVAGESRDPFHPIRFYKLNPINHSMMLRIHLRHFQCISGNIRRDNIHVWNFKCECDRDATGAGTDINNS